jgi:ketosteroid isomerase-like protein
VPDVRVAVGAHGVQQALSARSGRRRSRPGGSTGFLRLREEDTERVVHVGAHRCHGIRARACERAVAPPGMRRELKGRDTLREYHRAASAGGSLLEVEHHGYSHGSGGPYRLRALGVVRVRDGEIVEYDDHVDPIAMAALLGRTQDLVAALSAA